MIFGGIGTIFLAAGMIVGSRSAAAHKGAD
jgi:hypothetical protein